MTTTMTTLTERVAAFVAGLDLADVPAAVVEKAKVTLLHDVGVALAGRDLAGVAYAYAEDVGACAKRGARLLVDGTRVTVDAAAVATGALMHARTQDDTQLSVSTHLGCTTLPALLALGDRDGATGRDLLTAMVAGYEAASAIATGNAATATARGFRASSVYGPFASAAACARLLGLSEAQTVSALGLAAAFGGGLNQPWVAGTQEWQYQVGAASRNGMVAALLACRGVTGAPDALEGTSGHHRAFTGSSDADPSAAVELGTTWRTLDVTYKPYPVCAINQVPVSLLTELATEHDLRAGDVAEVSVALRPEDAAYPGTDAHGPFTDVGGSLMSAPYCLAVAVRERTVEVAHLREFTDAELMDLVRRVHVVADDTLPAASCRITVTTREGATFDGTLVPGPGTFAWDRDETARRVHGLVGEMPLSPAGLTELVDVVLGVDERTVRDLVSATLA